MSGWAKLKIEAGSFQEELVSEPTAWLGKSWRTGRWMWFFKITTDSPRPLPWGNPARPSLGAQFFETTGSARDFVHGAVFLAETAMQRFIVALYYDTTMPKYPWPPNILLAERNQAFVIAYQRGETLEHIAAAFDISIARVHQILKNGR